jgi:hypothetical protein
MLVLAPPDCRQRERAELADQFLVGISGETENARALPYQLHRYRTLKRQFRDQLDKLLDDTASP